RGQGRVLVGRAAVVQRHRRVIDRVDGDRDGAVGAEAGGRPRAAVVRHAESEAVGAGVVGGGRVGHGPGGRVETTGPAGAGSGDDGVGQAAGRGVHVGGRERV